MTAAADAPDAAERAYHAVSAMILSGEVAEGEWLRESALAEHIGVSRTPVREALSRLSAEGVVDVHPRRGAQVISLSEEELAALFDLRVRFEPLAAGLAVPRLAEEELRLLCDLADGMEDLERNASPDWQEMSRLNNEFHSVFFRHAGNRHLTTAIQAVTRPVVVARTFRTYSKHVQQGCSGAEHAAPQGADRRRPGTRRRMGGSGYARAHPGSAACATRGTGSERGESMKIGIVIGSVREGRVGAAVAEWVLAQAAGRDVEYELIDPREFDLPVYASEQVPALAERVYDDERVNAWSRAVDACDGFIFVTPEYNHSVPGALKNAFDSVFPEWWSKAIGFISYGAAFGFRAVEQWRLIVANANMFDVKAQVSLSTILHWQGSVFTPAERHAAEVETLLSSLEAASEAMSGIR